MSSLRAPTNLPTNRRRGCGAPTCRRIFRRIADTGSVTGWCDGGERFRPPARPGRASQARSESGNCAVAPPSTMSVWPVMYGGQVGARNSDRVGDVVRGGEAAERDVLGRRGPAVRAHHRFDARREHRARRDRVHAYSLAAELHRERAHERHEPRLGRAVRTVQRCRPQTAERRDRDERSPSVLAEITSRDPGQIEEVPQHEIEALVPRLVVELDASDPNASRR